MNNLDSKASQNAQREMIVPRRIQKGLRTDCIGTEIYHFTEVASTNDVAKEFAANAAKEGTVVIAETQSRGRGRLRRRWVSPAGGIYLSIILRPKVSPEDALKLTLMTAVAVAQGIRRTLSLSAEIKWPNDVLVDGKKVCGILTEMKTSEKTVDFVIVGIGINANVDTHFFPAHLRTSTTSLMQELGEEVELENFLRTLFEELEHYYKMFTRGESELILEEWRRLAGFLGSHVKVVGHDEEIVGLAVDVDQSGALLIKTQAGRVRKVASGDVASMRAVKH